jgi:hypothetical protein
MHSGFWQPKSFFTISTLALFSTTQTSWRHVLNISLKKLCSDIFGEIAWPSAVIVFEEKLYAGIIDQYQS